MKKSSIILLGLLCCNPTPPAEQKTKITYDQAAKPQVEQVTKNVWVARDYGLANSIMIEGPEGLVIIDTMESVEAAKEVHAAFRKISDKPVKAIIYTHNHGDHIFGSKVFVEEGTEIIAHATTTHYIDRIINVLRPIIYERSMRQFGTMLKGDEFRGNAVGPKLHFDHHYTPGLLRPTRTFDTPTTTMQLAGLEIQLLHAPGETPDQIAVFLPKQKILFPGDNFYHAFPNLYAIRGTSNRDTMTWVKSLDLFRTLGAEMMVPSHNQPIKGKDAVSSALRDYRDAIAYVHDQTVRGMKMAKNVDTLVREVKLPAHLANKPYLQETYGKVEFAVRSIYHSYMGWFGGDATDLKPLSVPERAERMAKLLGNDGAILKAAQDAYQAQDYQWAAELSRLASARPTIEQEAKQLWSKALSALGKATNNSPAHNFYLTQSGEIAGNLNIPQLDVNSMPEHLLRSFPIDRFMHAMPMALNPENSLDVEEKLGFRFKDTGQNFLIEVRKGVATVSNTIPADVPVLNTDSYTWKQVVRGRQHIAKALAAGDIEVDGSVIDVARFLRLFKS